MNAVESVGGMILIENEGSSKVDLGQGFVVGKIESFVVEAGVVEEGVNLIEKGGSGVENNHLGQGPQSFVVQVGVVEEGMGCRQLGVVVDSVDAGAVGLGVDDWRGLDGWRGVDDWMMQKKVSE